MQFVDFFLLLLVLAVSAWISRGKGLASRSVLFGTALLISAALFLPWSVLHLLVGRGGIEFMEAVDAQSRWTVAKGAHFLAFLWLSFVLWALRPDLRGWRGVGGLVILAVAAELAQGLTVERSARLGDVVLNLLGVGVGLMLAIAGARVMKIFGRRARHRG